MTLRTRSFKQGGKEREERRKEGRKERGKEREERGRKPPLPSSLVGMETNVRV